MKRKWRVGIIVLIAAGVLGWVLLGGDDRILREFEFKSARIGGVAADGGLVVLGLGELKKIGASGEMETFPITLSRGVIVGAKDYLVHELSPGALQMLDQAGRVKWTYQTNQPISYPAIDASGNIFFYGINWAVHSLDPEGKPRWTFPYATAAGGFQFMPPVVSPEGWVAVMGGGPSGLVVVDPQGVESWSNAAINGTAALTGGAFAPNGDLLVRDDWKLRRIAPDGRLLWLLDLAGFVDVSGVAAHGLTAPVVGPDGTIYCPIWKWVFAVGADGQHRWHFRRDGGPDVASSRLMEMGDAWSGFTRNGNLLLVAGDWESIALPPGAPGPVMFPPPVRNERLVCLNPDGSLAWEQAIPSSVTWSLPRSQLDIKLAWETKMGLHGSKGLARPTVTPDGTIYLQGLVDGKFRIWAIRGD